jgi:inhibitor of KinA
MNTTFDMAGVKFRACGDGALVVEFGDTIDRAINDRVLRLAAIVRDLADGIVETVPTFRSLLVQYDPLRISAADIEAAIRHLRVEYDATKVARNLWHLPACYAPSHAPDIADIASRAKLSVDEIVRLHSQTQFHVYLVGFAPGFAYMGDLPAALAFPRRTDPRVRVPAGSVAIAQTMTGVYPHESPGGWHLIATCPVRLFDHTKATPSLLAPGDAVRFEPVSERDFELVAADVRRGVFDPARETLT